MIPTQGEVSEAIKIICLALKEDPQYYITWQANIAMSFKDEYSRIKNEARVKGGPKAVNRLNVHNIANNAAKQFLDLLLKTNGNRE